tara:strand:- start:2070 stop:2612 length:543 start_codon:yes stop_codon:yes gene_type:complete
MKINNNTLYKIFFYLLILIFIIFVITNTIIEHYDDTNMCSISLSGIKEDTPIQDTPIQDTPIQDTPENIDSSSIQENKITSDNEIQNSNHQNLCDLPIEEESIVSNVSKEQLPDINIYNTNLYNSKKYLNQMGQKMVNYIDIQSNEDISTLQNMYPDAYQSYIDSLKKNPYLDTFVYIPM